MTAIRAGRIEEAVRSSGEWIFVDVGFSSGAKSCGLLEGDGKPTALTFRDMQARLLSLASSEGHPLNMVIEAPLSVSFGPNGNPAGRTVERRDGKARYWYVGLGCSVIVATTYLLRAVTDAQPNREIRLFEGFVSFKPRGVRSSHCDDVLMLRNLVWGTTRAGRVVPPEDLAASPEYLLMSAFSVAGMDYGVPPVIAVDG